jgi:hypothetical protein
MKTNDLWLVAADAEATLAEWAVERISAMPAPCVAVGPLAAARRAANAAREAHCRGVRELDAGRDAFEVARRAREAASAAMRAARTAIYGR